MISPKRQISRRITSFFPPASISSFIHLFIILYNTVIVYVCSAVVAEGSLGKLNGIYRLTSWAVSFYCPR